MILELESFNLQIHSFTFQKFVIQSSHPADETTFHIHTQTSTQRTIQMTQFDNIAIFIAFPLLLIVSNYINPNARWSATSVVAGWLLSQLAGGTLVWGMDWLTILFFYVVILFGERIVQAQRNAGEKFGTEIAYLVFVVVPAMAFAAGRPLLPYVLPAEVLAIRYGNVSRC